MLRVVSLDLRILLVVGRVSEEWIVGKKVGEWFDVLCIYLLFDCLVIAIMVSDRVASADRQFLIFKMHIGR